MYIHKIELLNTPLKLLADKYNGALHRIFRRNAGKKDVSRWRC